MSAASPSKEAVLFCDIPDEEPFEGSDPVQFLVAGAQSKHKAWYMGGAQKMLPGMTMNARLLPPGSHTWL